MACWAVARERRGGGGLAGPEAPSRVVGPRHMVGSSESWRCGLCGHFTPPVVGCLLAGSSRHRCRACGLTVCNECSVVPMSGVRTCKVCYLQSDAGVEVRGAPREKYVFLVRHAQSTWNRHIDTVKTLRSCSPDVSIKDVLSRAAHLMTREVWHRDHPLSDEGARQAVALRQRVAALRQESGPAFHMDKASPSSGSGCRPMSFQMVEEEEEEEEEDASMRPGTERERRYYSAFLAERQQIYCSPLLRALQTAHLALPEEDGWGSIKLLKDARERFTYAFERDCLGTEVGEDIVGRAVQMLGQDLGGLHGRVDAADCATKWWSDEPESEAQLEARLNSLWRRLMEEDCSDSCVLVTHSNLIKALLMRFMRSGHIGGEAGDTPTGGSCGMRSKCERGAAVKAQVVGEDSPASTDGADTAATSVSPSTPRAVGAAAGSVSPANQRVELGGLSDFCAGGAAGSLSPAVPPAAPASTAGDLGARLSAGRQSPAAASTVSPSRGGNLEAEDVYIPETVGTVTGERNSSESGDSAGEWSDEGGSTNAAWQVVEGGPEALRRLKVERLQNCGVLGLRCVLEEPLVLSYPEVDGWVDVDYQGARRASERCNLPGMEPQWVAKDALLMFDSVLVR